MSIFWAIGYRLFHTEYMQENSIFILSMKWTILQHPLSSPIYTLYEKDDVLQILSMKKTMSCIYSVWKWRRPANTHDKPSLAQSVPRQAYWPFIFSLEQKIWKSMTQKYYFSVPLAGKSSLGNQHLFCNLLSAIRLSPAISQIFCKSIMNCMQHSITSNILQKNYWNC